jgi:rubrerythrin
MSNLCNKLILAKKDEESGVTEYLDLKKELKPENEDQIIAIEGIISDEKNHLNKVNEMMKYYGCLEEEGNIKRRKRK